MPLSPVIAVLLLVVANCSDPGRGDFRPECRQTCSNQGQMYSCSGDTVDQCTDGCVANTNYLDPTCGRCIAADTKLTPGCRTDNSSVSDPQCSLSCRRGTHEEVTNFEPECEVACRQEGQLEECSNVQECIDSCVAATEGKSTLCGKCLAADMNLTPSCIVEPSSVDDRDCVDFCP